MEIFILIGIVLAGLVLLLWYRSNKNTKVTVEANAEPVAVETAPYKVPEPVATTSVPLVVEETTTSAAVVEPAPAVVEEIVAIIEEPPAVEKPAAKPKRAKVNGKFVKDDPATPENEAWEGGVAPPKKPKAAPKPKRTRKPKA